jgi:hypothetical protein
VRRTSGPQHFAFGGSARFCLVPCQARDGIYVAPVAQVARAGRRTGQALLPVAFISQ